MYAEQAKAKSNASTDNKKETLKSITAQNKAFSAVNSLELSKPGIFQPKMNKERADTKASLFRNKSGGIGLPDQLKSRIEGLSGCSMDDVNVHYNSSKPAQLQALAYTQGKEIFVAPGQEKHLGHEAWHVVQQMQGRVSPTVRMKGVNINDDPALEHEADIMGGKTVQFKINDQYTAVRSESSQGSVVQMLSDPPHDENVEFRDIDSGPILEIRSNTDLQDYFFENANRFCNDFLYCPLYNGIKEIIRDVKKDESIFTDELQGVLDESSAEKIWKSIHDKFMTKDNIHTVLGKSLSRTTGANHKRAIWNTYLRIINKCFNPSEENVSQQEERGNELEPLNPAENPQRTNNSLIRHICDFILDKNIEIFQDLNVTIGETLNDIFYWSCRQKNGPDSSNPGEVRPVSYGKKVTEIILTDSDVHIRGIGVCIVTFEDEKKLVVKPERKDFEKIVYGKNDPQSGRQSLASIFNALGHDVGELRIDVAKKHGSAIEYFNHNDITKMSDKEIESLNRESIIDIVEFASLLGLGDLHHENMVYGADSKKAQLIDSEVGIKYPMSFDSKDPNKQNPFLTSIQLGELLTATPRDDKVRRNDYANEHTFEQKDKLKNFLNIAKTKLSGFRSRRVVIPTGELYKIREKIYFGYKFDLDDYKDALNRSNTCKNGDWQINEDNIKGIYDLMIKDFKKGRIPFYEYDFDTGNIIQKFSGNIGRIVLLNKNKSMNNVIRQNMAVLDNWLEQPLKRSSEEASVKHEEKNCIIS